MDDKELQMEMKREYFWKRTKRAFCWFLVGVVLAGVPLGKVVHDQKAQIRDLESELEDYYNLEDQKAEITETAVWETLSPISELSTFLVDYGNSYSLSTSQTGIFGETVPFSTNNVSLLYHGIIKVGIDVDQIDLRVDNRRQTITVTLPEPKVLDNYINLDDLQCTAKNNILNPIDVTEMPGILSTCAARGLESAENQGLYTKARDNAEKVIRELLSVFAEYEVVFE